MQRMIPALLVFALTSGCSYALDTERVQCKKPEDCEKINEDYPLTCSNNLCVLKKDLECRTTEACLDGNYCAMGSPDCVCNTETNLCVESLSCDGDADCKKYQGSEDFICLEDVCEPPQCGTPADCMAIAPGLTCVAGRCRDLLWGCVNEPDPREPEKGEEPTFRIKVLHAPAPLAPVKNLQVKVCLPGDPACRVTTGKYTYDEEEGWLEVTGLRDDGLYNIRLEGESPSGEELAPGTIYMARPIRGITEESEPALLFTRTTRDGFGPVLKVPIDTANMGLVIARVFDCQGKSAENIVFNTQSVVDCVDQSQATPDRKCSTERFYFDKSNFPTIDELKTTTAGVGGFINTVTAASFRVTFTRDGQSAPYTEVEVYPIADEVSYLAVYPGVF